MFTAKQMHWQEMEKTYMFGIMLIEHLETALKVKVKVLVAQLCLTLCYGLLCPWNPLGKNTGGGCHALLQEIFPTQGSNLDLPHCRQILYHLGHQGSPRYSLNCTNNGSHTKATKRSTHLPSSFPSLPPVLSFLPLSFATKRTVIFAKALTSLVFTVQLIKLNEMRFPACQCRRHKRRRFSPWVGKIPWRAQEPSPVLLPREPMDRGAWWAIVRRFAQSRT